jgi:hypothetical protein
VSAHRIYKWQPPRGGTVAEQTNAPIHNRHNKSAYQYDGARPVLNEGFFVNEGFLLAKPQRGEVEKCIQQHWNRAPNEDAVGHFQLCRLLQ